MRKLFIKKFSVKTCKPFSPNAYNDLDVTIINRGDHFGDRLKNFQVHVGQNLIVRRNPTCHDRVRQAGRGEAIRLQCDPPIPGQFVGIQVYGKATLSVCEVIVASRLGEFLSILYPFGKAWSTSTVIIAQ